MQQAEANAGNDAVAKVTVRLRAAVSKPEAAAEREAAKAAVKAAKAEAKARK